MKNITINKLILNKSWVPNSVCKTCYSALLLWTKRKRPSMPYAVPMIWADPGEHDPANCYACANQVYGMNKIKAKLHKYCAVPSAQTPLLHSESIPLPPHLSLDILSTWSATAPSTTSEETAD